MELHISVIKCDKNNAILRIGDRYLFRSAIVCEPETDPCFDTIHTFIRTYPYFL